MPLLYTNEATELLKKEYGLAVSNFEQKVCYFANLFIPLSMNKADFFNINTDCIEGFWIRKENFTKKEFGNNTYRIPRKENWIVSPASNTNWYSYDAINIQIDKHLHQKRTPLIWLKTPDQKFQKFFVVWW